MLSFLANMDSNLLVGVGVAVAAVIAVKYLNMRADVAHQRAYEVAKARQEALKKEREKPIKRRFFSPEELLPFNGEDGQPIYIALLDEVYPNVGRILRRRDLTLEQLKQFNGRDNLRKTVYVALNGNIYDVTLDGLDHYGPDGGYKQFAGRDCSRSLACMSFLDEYLDNPTLDGITEQQHDVLNKWEDKFKEKYPIVGKIIK
ncbi:hypothetical protein KXD40_003428 [Peronospora effusa]|nr:hypothetical protein KXD40_003428 [Peronospora effusa]